VKILLVDDNRLTLGCLEELLRLEGHDTVAAETGEEALMRRALWKPDLVILDLVLPGLSGFEVLRNLRRMSAAEGLPRVPAVVITAASHQEIDAFLQQADGLQPFLVLCKPFEMATLLSAIDQIKESTND